MRGIVLVVAYCVGLGAPFVLFALASGRAMRHWAGCVETLGEFRSSAACSSSRSASPC